MCNMSNPLERERRIAGTKRGADLHDFRRFFGIERVYLSPYDWRLRSFDRFYDAGEAIRQCGKPLSLAVTALAVIASGYVVSLGIYTVVSEHLLKNSP